MVYKLKALDPPLIYEEKTRSERRRRYCLKNIKLIETKAAKDDNCINILFNRGTKTSVNIDNVEERKIQEHCNYVTAKLEKLHKNIMWNIYVGRSYLDKVEVVSRVMDELSLDHSDQGDFDVNNPKTWSKESMAHIETTLDVNEVPRDGVVCLFSVRNDSSDRDIDYDEVAWELEKAVVYHCISLHPQRLLNQEAVMARQGLEPHSRKVRTPGRNRAGYVVYLAYQLVESVTYSQVMLDTVFYAVDIETKKKQLLHQLGDLKLSPAVDDRIRKQVKDVKEFMSGDQVALLHCIKELRDPAKLGVVLQFVQLIQAGDSKTSMAGINQFVSFLSDKEDSRKASSKTRNLSRSNSVRSRKQSSSSFSSCSTSSELPPAAAGQLVRNSAGSCASLSSPRPRPGPATPTRKTSKRQSHLADIPDQEADQGEEQGEEQEQSLGQEQQQEAEVKRRVTSASAGTSGRQLSARKPRPASACDLSPSPGLRSTRTREEASRRTSVSSPRPGTRPALRK